MSHPHTIHKGIVIILDGLGDRPVAALGGRTPLEAAHTPRMDHLAHRGMCGLVDPLAFGIPVGTQVGVGLLLGLAARDAAKLKRGPVEAAGVGFQLHDGNVAIRCNFATLASAPEGLAIVDRRAGRIRKGTVRLAAALDGMDLGGGITARVRASTEHRVVLLLTGPRLSDAITDTDPGAGRDTEGVLTCVEWDVADKDAAITANAVNDFISRSHAILKDHPINLERDQAGLLPANGLITRGAGKVVRLPNLLNHLGLQVAIVAGEGTIVGLGNLFGFDVITRSTFSGTPDTDLDHKVTLAQQALADHDLVFLHIKGTDTLAHDLQPLEKMRFIEKIDRALTPLVTMDAVIGITGDHCTDSSVGRHTGDPVPSILYAGHGRRDASQRFDEVACMQGGIQGLTASSYLTGMLDLMGHMHNYRPDDQVYL